MPSRMTKPSMMWVRIWGLTMARCRSGALSDGICGGRAGRWPDGSGCRVVRKGNGELTFFKSDLFFITFFFIINHTLRNIPRSCINASK